MKKYAWKDLGVNKWNDSSLLWTPEIFKTTTLKIFSRYKAGRINQHSVGMQYVKIDLMTNNSKE
jgi:hypothetical protein